VELKTPIFRLFLDIDARVDATHTDIDFQCLFELVHQCALDFFDSREYRMIVCSTELKHEAPDGTVKHGFHIVFPSIYVNAPIALAFRGNILQKVDELPISLHNTWGDVIDDSVYKANGLRALFSAKGQSELRCYVPRIVFADDGLSTMIQDAMPASEKRLFVHECSIRAFEAQLTSCRGGEDSVADSSDVHRHNGVVIGKRISLSAYADVLPKVQDVLPSIYSTQRFTGAFVTRHAIMLRSSSRFCGNVGREHRTSTVYFCVTKRAAGVYQKCYCRKDEHGCVDYSGPIIALDLNTLKTFFPDDYDDQDAPSLPSKKHVNTFNSLLQRTRFASQHQHTKKKKKM